MSSGANAVAMTSSRRSDILHRFDGIAHQIEQNLLNLHLVGQHEVGARVELEAHAHALSLAPTSASALASSTSFLTSSTRRSLSPRATKSRKRRMIWPARKRLLGGLVHGLAQRS